MYDHTLNNENYPTRWIMVLRSTGGSTSYTLKALKMELFRRSYGDARHCSVILTWQQVRDSDSAVFLEDNSVVMKFVVDDHDK